MFSVKRKQNLEFLTIQNFTLRQVSIDMNVLSGKKLLKNHWKFIFSIICVLYVHFGLINFVAHTGIAQIYKASTCLLVFNQCSLILIKLIVFLAKGDKFMKLIWDINHLAEKANPQEKKLWLSENLLAQKIAKTYFYACSLSVTVGLIFPLLYMAYDYSQKHHFTPVLPYGGKFPYYTDGLLLFIINYILSVVYIFILANMTVGLDTLYIWYIYSISAHFRILRKKVHNAGLNLSAADNSINFNQEIGLILNYHNRILDFVKDLNNAFGLILWAEVTLSCLEMCFILYALQNDDNIFNMPFNFMSLVVITIQLLIYCFGGEKIKNESLLLSLDFYLCFPWHLMLPKEKKLMLLPLQRSQQLSGLRGIFFEVDRNLFVFIAKTAFSFNTLLSAMKE